MPRIGLSNRLRAQWDFVSRENLGLQRVGIQTHRPGESTVQNHQRRLRHRLGILRNEQRLRQARIGIIEPPTNIDGICVFIHEDYSRWSSLKSTGGGCHQGQNLFFQQMHATPAKRFRSHPSHRGNHPPVKNWIDQNNRRNFLGLLEQTKQLPARALGECVNLHELAKNQPRGLQKSFKVQAVLRAGFSRNQFGFFPMQEDRAGDEEFNTAGQRRSKCSRQSPVPRDEKPLVWRVDPDSVNHRCWRVPFARNSNTTRDLLPCRADEVDILGKPNSILIITECRH